jgi:hypothetical protein
MAISGHKTLSQVQRYTSAADKKRLADSAMAKMAKGRNENTNVTNTSPESYKHGSKSLKTTG